MEILTIKINGVDLDLYPNEKVVQTFSLLNINDITARQSEYSNTFKVPKTNNNLQIIDYSHYINNTTTFPFSKVTAEIYINGFLFKKGLIELVEIEEDISLRFYSGNIAFFDIIKQKSLKDIDANNNSNLIINWTLTDVLGTRNAIENVFFPLIDYNGMSDTGNTVDVRRLLPAYYKLSLIEAMCNDAGYQLINEVTGDALTALEKDIVPTASNKLENNADDIALNSYEGEMLDGTGDTDPRIFGFYSWTFSQFSSVTHAPIASGSKNHNFSTLVSGNPDRYVQPVNNLDHFACFYSGSYDISYNLDVLAIFENQWDSLPPYTCNSTAYWFIQVNGINVYQIGSVNTLFGNPNTSGSVTDNFSGTYTLNLNSGDIVRLVSNFSSTIYVGAFSATTVSNNHKASLYVLDGSTFGVSLGAGIAFGSQINPSQCLPDIKQNDFLKDTCIRYCILPFVDDDLKILYLKPFQSVKDNISNNKDWSDLVDETKEPSLTFKLGDYAQKNNFKHLEDKSVEPIPIGSDSIVNVQNQNLEQEKTVYTSCFAPSLTVTKLVDSEMIAIDLYDGTGFNNDVKPRCCYTRLVNKSIDYTDGTTTTNVTTNIPHTWFISGDRSYNAGFDNNLLNDYSNELIAIIQNPKVLKIDIRLSLINILQLNYFYPIYLKQYNAYFFLSSINQFDYTSNEATEVELIKLN